MFPVDLNVSEKAKYMSPLVFFKLVYMRVLQKQYYQSQKKKNNPKTCTSALAVKCRRQFEAEVL